MHPDRIINCSKKFLVELIDLLQADERWIDDDGNLVLWTYPSRKLIFHSIDDNPAIPGVSNESQP